jgi:hypothetical protein
MIQGVALNYNKSMENRDPGEIRYSVKVKIDLAYSRSRLPRAVAALKPTSRIIHEVKRSRLELAPAVKRVNV